MSKLHISSEELGLPPPSPPPEHETSSRGRARLQGVAPVKLTSSFLSLSMNLSSLIFLCVCRFCAVKVCAMHLSIARLFFFIKSEFISSPSSLQFHSSSFFYTPQSSSSPPVQAFSYTALHCRLPSLSLRPHPLTHTIAPPLSLTLLPSTTTTTPQAQILSLTLPLHRHTKATSPLPHPPLHN